VLVTPTDRLRIGAGIFNVGQQVQFISASDPLPTIARLGVAYEVLRIPHHSLLLSAESAYDLNAQTDSGAAGLEYWFDKTLAIRGGYAGDAYQQHWTAGVGINLNIFQLDYAYSPISTLGDTHRLSLILRFGTDLTEGLLGPTGFTARPLDQGLSLSWKPSSSPDVVGYNLYVKKPGMDNFTRVTSQPIHQTSVKLTHLSNGQSYGFQVSAVSAAGRESAPIQVAGIPGGMTQEAVFGPPTGFKASPKGEGLELSWDPSTTAAGYNLYLVDDQGKAVKKLSAQTITEPRVVLKRVNPATTYHFALVSVDRGGNESGLTAPLVANWQELQKGPGVPIPGNFRVAGGNASANLSWEAVQGAIGYNLYTSDDGRTYKLLTKKGPRNVQSALLRPLKNGKTYYFAVTAVTQDGKESEKTVQTVVPAP
jgi:fibronectin type 3 domain-containing protein